MTPSDLIDAAIRDLLAAPLVRFGDVGIARVPSSAGIYAVWNLEGLFVYAGMSGKGLGGRLKSHASGRRGGDQFCIYVFDRFVIPTLERRTIEAVAAGELRRDYYDRLTGDWIRSHLAVRFVVLNDEIVGDVERRLRARGVDGTPPLLNPLLPSAAEQRAPRPAGS